ncbi:ATP-dependent helicase HrpB [Celerinatantimonas sp. YJH-8]|uniref:ATP-dependent helicase HrpB n=1 Tax=Celerinatantimonas sp. YJH-8 TaxID=3228714 RepID=UPI0038C74F7D
MSSLPVESIIAPLLTALKHERQILLAAPPGAGKSTAVPLAILEQGQLEGLVVMLEPRRLAARHIASYLAEQLGESVGERVGYQMRGESKRSRHTQLLIVTEGILTRMLQDDPLLESVSLVIFDEFHERSLQADLGLALCQEAGEVNDSLRLLVMSATLDISAIQRTLPQAVILSCEGRSYPVAIDYQPQTRVDEPLESHCGRVISQLLDEQPGNILVFLPGVLEIKRVAQVLRVPDDVQVYSLYGQLSLSEQRTAIAPPQQGLRKVVLATNIAETSLTIDGITMVVDSGLERVAQYHAASGVTRLTTRMICQSSAEQRAGRAGRQQAGRCVRLYSAELLNHRPRFNDPQILRSDLSSLVFQLKLWGADSDDLNWVDPPPKGALEGAEALLRQLALVDEQGGLNGSVRTLSQLSSEPRSMALLLKAQDLAKNGQADALARGCYLAALLEQSLPRAETGWLEDALRRLDGVLKKQLLQQARRYATSLHATSLIDRPEHPLDGILLAAALPDRIGQRRADQRHYLLANGFAVAAQQTDQALIVALDVGWQPRQSSGRLYLSAPLTEAALREFYPHWFDWQSRYEFDEARQMFISERRQCLGALVFARQPGSSADAEALIREWSQMIRRRGIDWLPIPDEAQALRDRIICVRQWFPEHDFPDVSDDGLLEHPEQWLGGYLGDITRYKQLTALDWSGMIRHHLDWSQQQQLEQWAPTHYRAPSGRRVPIQYQPGQSPRISLKLQEMFGEPQTPTVAGGRIALTIELLSPAGRPLQLTQDLASFWQNGYSQVRKEMRGRYPKHPWPEDPTRSVATQKTNRQLRRE